VTHPFAFLGNEKETMVKYVKLFALFLLIVFYSFCNAQNKTELPTEVITSHGPNTSVRIIRQDRKGNIWLASNEGSIRYDGKSFTNITGKLSLDRFFSVLEDRKGNFWFRNYGSGVYYYDARLNDEVRQGKSFQHFTTKEGLVNDRVFTIYEDKNGNIWFGTIGGVSRYDARLNDEVGQGNSFRNFTTKEGLSNTDVTTIIEDKTGKFWFGTRGNAFVYDGKTFAIFTHEGKTVTNVWLIMEDKKGNIWLGGNRLWRYDGSAFTQIDQMGAGVIIKDKKGNVLTSIGGPIFHYDEQSLSDKKPHVTVIKTKYEGRRNLPFGMLGANDGSIWIGSDRYSYDGKTLTDFKSKEGQK